MKVILKIGTSVLVNNINGLDLVLMQNLVCEISRVYNQGVQIILITSGAVATGREMVNNLLSRSSFAALGQTKLIKYYYDFFGEQGIQIAQVLLSANSFKNRSRFNLLKETLTQLTDNRIIPIINENDTTVLKDSFGDNDSLAAIISVLVSAQKLVFLTDLDGLYSSDPKTGKNARLIKEVESVDLEIQRMCSKNTSKLGQGGMLSKLKGAKLATTCGIDAFIMSGLNPNNISKLLLNNQPVGTKFTSRKSHLSERKKRLLIGTVSESRITVDQGAKKALEDKNSLLAVGLRGIKGDFMKGDFVNIIDKKGEVFAFGVVNYGSKELMPLLSLRDKDEIRRLFRKAVVHIDNLILLKC